MFCPITSKEKGYPFEVKIKGKTINGCVLSEQIKSLDVEGAKCGVYCKDVLRGAQ